MWVVFFFQAKVDNEILDYRDLAAIPKVKAIYDIERPDLINYEPLYTTSLDELEERESVGEVKLHKHSVHLCVLHACMNSTTKLHLVSKLYPFNLKVGCKSLSPIIRTALIS